MSYCSGSATCSRVPGPLTRWSFALGLGQLVGQSHQKKLTLETHSQASLFAREMASLGLRRGETARKIEEMEVFGALESRAEALTYLRLAMEALQCRSMCFSMLIRRRRLGMKYQSLKRSREA